MIPKRVSGSAFVCDRERLSAAGRSRHTGSALIMVIVTLSLMAILAAVHLKTAQTDVSSTKQSTRGRYIDEVSDAVIVQIKAALRDDLLHEHEDGPPLFFSSKVGDEPYDYPWTNRLDLDDPDTRQWRVTLSDGSEEWVAGGFMDDTWLASTQPDFSDPLNPESRVSPDEQISSVVWRWPHITNLNGIFLHSGSSTDPADLTKGSPQPIEEPVINNLAATGQLSDAPDQDTRVPLTSKYLVDADADGVGDSRWTWAPIRQVNGVAYVMAVRIIDNSSLLNINVATSQVGSTGQYDPMANAPRWWYPSELDLGGFLWGYGVNDDLNIASDTVMTELESLMFRRLGSTGDTIPTPWLVRQDLWLSGYDPDASEGSEPPKRQSLAINDELEMRYRNGLNHLPVESTIERSFGSEAGGPGTLHHTLRQSRADPDDDTINERHYTHFFSDPNNPDSESENPDSDSYNHDWTRMLAFFEQNPRSKLTTRNGAGALAIPTGQSGYTSAVSSKLFLDGSRGLSAISNRIRSVVFRHVEEGETNHNNFRVPLTIANPIPSNPNEEVLRQYCDQFAVNIRDCMDNDNHITQYKHTYKLLDETPVSHTHYGMEALPFLTEVYVQGRYKITAADGDDEEVGDWTATWERQGNVGYAIEIRNPWNRRISLEDVYLWVHNGDGTDDAVENWGQLSDLAGMTQLGARQVLILYRHSNEVAGTEEEGMIPGTNNDDVDKLATDDTANGQTLVKQKLIVNWPQYPSGTYVGLRATVKAVELDETGESEFESSEDSGDPPLPTELDPTEALWPYVLMKVDDAMDLTYTTTVAANDDPSTFEVYDYRQRVSLGNGEGVNMMTITTADVQQGNLKDLRHKVGSNDGDVTGGINEDDQRLESLTLLGLSDKTIYPNPSPDLSEPAGSNVSNFSALSPGPSGNGGNKLDVDEHQLLISDQDAQIGELAHIAVFSPKGWDGIVAADKLTATVADGWVDINDVKQLMLNFEAVELFYDQSIEKSVPDELLPPVAKDLLRVPHAVMIMDQFTSYHPLSDGVDNNFDGEKDEASEQLVRGTINLNTVSGDLSSVSAGTHLLQHVLPIPDSEVRNNVIRGIIKYRDRLGVYRLQDGSDQVVRHEVPIGIPGYRKQPGIAYLGELMEVVDRNDPSNHETVDTLGKDFEGATAKDNDQMDGVQVDFINPEGVVGDGVANDREEEAMIARWLMQVCSTRSDIFTAYVLIQGFEAGDFSKGPVEATRFFAVFDRSGVTGLADTDAGVRVLGIYRMN